MRIQHNIMAMNAYRNYNTNVNRLSGNLEKLSSGYRINRAGDDAAGLAISEKMRAQITGLDAAQKNVKDGISLVKTAEGAMQEIQDMLNRMKYLAVQSANGTYDDEVDRANLQKEADALMAEINRIADSANFNGRKLLDGTAGGVSIKATNAAAPVATPGTTLTVGNVSVGDASNPASFTVMPAYDTTSTQNMQIGDKYFVINPAGVASGSANVGDIPAYSPAAQVGGGNGTSATPYIINLEEGDTTADISAAIVSALGSSNITIDGTAYTATADSAGQLTLTATENGTVTVGGTEGGTAHTEATLSEAIKNAISVQVVESSGGNSSSSTIPELQQSAATGANQVGTAAVTAVYSLDLSGTTPASGSTFVFNGKTYEFVDSSGSLTNESYIKVDYTGTSSTDLAALAAAIGENDANYSVSETSGVLTLTAKTAGAIENETGTATNASTVVAGDGTLVSNTAVSATVTTLGEAASNDYQAAVTANVVSTIVNANKLVEGDTITIGDETFVIGLTDGYSSSAGTVLDFSDAASGITAEALANELTTAMASSAPAGYTFAATAVGNDLQITLTSESAGAADTKTEDQLKALVTMTTSVTDSSGGTSGTMAVSASGSGTDAKGQTTMKFTTNPQVGSVIKVGDATFEFVAAGGSATVSGATAVEVGADLATSMTNLSTAVSGATLGDITATFDADTNTFTFVNNAANATDNDIAPTITTSGMGMRLQIGDTAEDYNQLNVSINDMHTEALGISTYDISTLEGAEAAVDLITDAINYVSSTRGDLGAIQNRLEHTANNLSVMEENIQDAESTIRDTDVADEMMAYTKNNILIQSAQAMLAQANAVPQGVLQLLQ